MWYWWEDRQWKDAYVNGADLQLEGCKKFCKLSPRSVTTSNSSILYISKCRWMYSQFYYKEMINVWGDSYA